MGRYLSFHEEMQKQFGRKVYKLSLDAGMTCPNRDGRSGYGGCIFCDGGSGAFAARREISLQQQIEQAKARIRKKAGPCPAYMAYFQSYTNTYAPVERLEELFIPVAAREDICALSIATRPDCLPVAVLDLLTRLNSMKPVFVELGLQTIHEKTAEYIRRGYPLEVFDRAVAELKRRQIPVVVHMILGLPGETPEMIRQTAAYIGASGVQGIKLQLLHVLKGTDLAADYAAGKFSAMEMETYIQLLEDCLRLLPPQMVVHRLTGDGERAKLIAPLWSADKKRVLNAIWAALERDDVRQGQWYAAWPENA